MSILADIVFLRTYADIKENGQKETWDECITRFENFMIKTYPNLEKVIKDATGLIRSKKIVPSMRCLQFCGLAVERENARAYNCSVIDISTFKDFAELVYLLMCGTGVGVSVQKCHIENLPIVLDTLSGYYTIEDSREGWADSIKHLLYCPNIEFDYSKLRPRGALLSTGGASSGKEPLEKGHQSIRAILKGAIGRQLTQEEVADICCIIADFVVVGGVRRSATIGLFDDLETVKNYKSGNWWENHSYRSNMNISYVSNADILSKEVLTGIVEQSLSGWGEPGLVLVKDSNINGLNPCAEISLRYNTLCNLTEINVANITSKEEFEKACMAATILGTLQAGLLDFHYLSDRWKIKAKEDSLLGVSLTGQAMNWDNLCEWLKDTSITSNMRNLNYMLAKLIGINPAKRMGTTKPSGTTSAVLDCTSGIHAGYAPYYLRRIRVDINNPIGAYLNLLPENPFMEVDKFNSQNLVLAVPMIGQGIMRTQETALDLLNRMLFIKENWILPLHREGKNSHNVSLTVEVSQSEQQDVIDWMWENKENYVGISLLPKDNNKYEQAPFEAISEEYYNSIIGNFNDIFSKLNLFTLDFSEYRYNNDKGGSVACGGGACEVK